jgi:hypothetical protein
LTAAAIQDRISDSASCCQHTAAVSQLTCVRYSCTYRRWSLSNICNKVSDNVHDRQADAIMVPCFCDVVAALLDLLTWWRTGHLITCYHYICNAYCSLVPATDDTLPGSSAVVGAAVPRRLKVGVGQAALATQQQWPTPGMLTAEQRASGSVLWSWRGA